MLQVPPPVAMRMPRQLVPNGMPRHVQLAVIWVHAGAASGKYWMPMPTSALAGSAMKPMSAFLMAVHFSGVPLAIEPDWSYMMYMSTGPRTVVVIGIVTGTVTGTMIGVTTGTVIGVVT